MDCIYCLKDKKTKTNMCVKSLLYPVKCCENEACGNRKPHAVYKEKEKKK